MLRRLALLLSLSLPSLFSAAAHAELPAEHARVSGTLAQGLWLGATLEGAYLARDLWAGGSLGLGFEHASFALHLRAPLYLSVVDLPPHRENPAPACAFVRCAEWLDESGELRLESLSRVVDHLRLGRPGDLFYARAGPLFATLGSGRVVDRYLNSPEHDRRQSGVYARLSLPFAGLSSELVVGNLFAPQRFTGGRLEARPLEPLLGGLPLVGGLLGRLTLALDGAADLTVASPYTFRRDRRATLASGALEALWPLFPEGGLFSFTPFASLGIAHGLSPDGNMPLGMALGLGTSAGARAELRVPFVAFRAQASANLDGAGHRTGLFGTLYEVERQRAFAGASQPSGNLVSVPAPGGLGWSARGEVVFLDITRVGLRYLDDTAPGGDLLEAYGEVGFFGFLAGVRALRRGAEGAHDLFALDERTLIVAESSLRVWGPLSLFARWYRTPRVERSGALRVDDDVLVGVSGDLVLGFGFPDDGE